MVGLVMVVVVVVVDEGGFSLGRLRGRLGVWFVLSKEGVEGSEISVLCDAVGLLRLGVGFGLRGCG